MPHTVSEKLIFYKRSPKHLARTYCPHKRKPGPFFKRHIEESILSQTPKFCHHIQPERKFPLQDSSFSSSNWGSFFIMYSNIHISRHCKGRFFSACFLERVTKLGWQTTTLSELHKVAKALEKYFRGCFKCPYYVPFLWLQSILLKHGFAETRRISLFIFYSSFLLRQLFLEIWNPVAFCFSKPENSS